jgi:hypothetical protein
MEVDCQSWALPGEKSPISTEYGTGWDSVESVADRRIESRISCLPARSLVSMLPELHLSFLAATCRNTAIDPPAEISVNKYTQCG